MGNVMRDGVSVEEQTAGQAPESAPAQSEAEKALTEGMTLYQAGDHRGALALLRPLADRGDGSACFLVAQIYKEDGDLVRCRNYLDAAAQQGDGDAALMLAQEYAREGDGITALEWAEKAHELKAVGAGRLMLRLGKYKKDWEIVVWKALSEVEWLPDEACVELCVDLRKVLKGGHIPEEQMPGLVEPVAEELAARNFTAASILLEPCWELKKKQEEKEQAQKEREEEQEKAQKAKKKAVAKNRVGEALVGIAEVIFRGPVSVLVCLALAMGLNWVCDKMVTTACGDSLGLIIGAPLGGLMNCLLCCAGMGIYGQLVDGDVGNGIETVMFTLLKAAIPCAIGGAILNEMGLFSWLVGTDFMTGVIRSATILLAFVCGLHTRYGEGW